MKFTKEQKEHIKKLIARYQRFIDATSECRYCGSACECCYRLAIAKQLKIEWIAPEPGSCGGWGGSGMEISAGSGGGGAGYYNEYKTAGADENGGRKR